MARVMPAMPPPMMATWKGLLLIFWDNVILRLTLYLDLNFSSTVITSVVLDLYVALMCWYSVWLVGARAQASANGWRWIRLSDTQRSMAAVVLLHTL